MEAKDYLKSKKIWLGTKVADMNAPENYFELEHLLEDYHQAKLKLLDIPVSTYAKLRKALETIRDAYYTDGETDKEKVDDLKAIAFNVLYEIDNNIEVE